MKRWQNCEFLSIFLNKRRFEQIYKTSLQNETVRKLQKEQVVGKCSVKKVLLKTSQNS